MAATRLESRAARAYPDFRDHLDALDRAGLLFRVDEPIDKDAEMHPLVRWQFRGGLKEDRRRAFLFTDVTDAKGRRYDMPVVIGALAANAAIYAIGMGVPVEEIGNRWNAAIANPIPPERWRTRPARRSWSRARRCWARGGGSTRCRFRSRRRDSTPPPI